MKIVLVEIDHKDTEGEREGDAIGEEQLCRPDLGIVRVQPAEADRCGSQRDCDLRHPCVLGDERPERGCLGFLGEFNRGVLGRLRNPIVLRIEEHVSGLVASRPSVKRIETPEQ